MAEYVPWMRSLLDRMKELYNKPNATTIAEALPELGSGGGGGTDSNAVHYTADSGKTDEQKAQARANIGAVANSDIPDVSGLEPKKMEITVTESGETYHANTSFSQMWAAYSAKKAIVVVMGDTEFVLSAADPSGMAFTSLSVGSGNATLSMLTVDENDDWSYAEFAAEQQPTTVTVSGTTPTIAAAANTAYNCGELASLTVSSSPASGAYSIVFTSGATPSVTSFPATILGLEDFAAEAGTVYEINVLDGRAVYKGWALPSSE